MQQIIDLHCDTILEIQAGANIGDDYSSGHIDIPRLRKGNVGCQVFACFISSVIPESNAYEEVLKLLDLIDDTCQQFHLDFQKVDNSEEISTVIENDKIAIIPAVENGYVIANDLKKLEKLRLLGSRYMTLTHLKNLDWAASSGESRCDFEGLTAFGEKVIAAMNEMGMIIDVSHVHESTFWAAIRLSNRPVIASHSNAITICPSSRNLTDDQIRAIAGCGGMIGINFFPGFLNSVYVEEQMERCRDLLTRFDEIEIENWQDPVKRAAAMHNLGKDFTERMDDVKVGIDEVVDHIGYIINLVGDDYVGFGSDFDGLPALPDGVTGCDIFPSIIDLMIKRDFTPETIDKICSKNFLRILKDNE